MQQVSSHFDWKPGSPMPQGEMARIDEAATQTITASWGTSEQGAGGTTSFPVTDPRVWIKARITGQDPYNKRLYSWVELISDQDADEGQATLDSGLAGELNARELTNKEDVPEGSFVWMRAGEGGSDCPYEFSYTGAGADRLAVDVVTQVCPIWEESGSGAGGGEPESGGPTRPFSFRRQDVVNVPHDTLAIIPWDDVADPYGYHSPATPTFIHIPVSGWYAISCMVNLLGDSTVGIRRLSLRCEGVILAEDEAHDVPHPTLAVAVANVHLSAGNVLVAQVYQLSDTGTDPDGITMTLESADDLDGYRYAAQLSIVCNVPDVPEEASGSGAGGRLVGIRVERTRLFLPAETRVGPITCRDNPDDCCTGSGSGSGSGAGESLPETVLTQCFGSTTIPFRKKLYLTISPHVPGGGACTCMYGTFELTHEPTGSLYTNLDWWTMVPKTGCPGSHLNWFISCLNDTKWGLGYRCRNIEFPTVKEDRFIFSSIPASLSPFSWSGGNFNIGSTSCCGTGTDKIDFVVTE